MDNYTNDLPKIYKPKSEKDKKNIHQMYYNHRKRLSEDRIDICKGNVIKSKFIIEETPLNVDSVVEENYEDKVNEILQQSGLNDQSNIDDIVQKETKTQEILRANNNQANVNKFIKSKGKDKDNER